MNTIIESSYNSLPEEDIQKVFNDAVDYNLLNFRYCGFFIRTMNSQVKAAEIRQAKQKNGISPAPYTVCNISMNTNSQFAGIPVMETSAFNEACKRAHRAGTRIVLLTGENTLLWQDMLDVASSHPEIIFPVLTDGTGLDTEKIRFLSKHKNIFPILDYEENTDGQSHLTYVRELMRRRKMLYGMNLRLSPENLHETLDPQRISEHQDKGCMLFIYTEDFSRTAGQKREILRPAYRKMASDQVDALRSKVPALHLFLPQYESRLVAEEIPDSRNALIA